MLLSGAMEVDAFLAWQELGRVDLVTADGSIDCSSDPAHQERDVAPLLYAETV